MEIKYILILAILLVILNNNKVCSTNTNIPVDSDTAKINIQNSEYDHILDIRTTMEKSIGHLTIATHISLEDLVSIENVIENKSDKILIISKNSKRANMFAQYISNKGYSNVSYLNDFWTKLA